MGVATTDKYSIPFSLVVVTVIVVVIIITINSIVVITSIHATVGVYLQHVMPTLLRKPRLQRS